MNKEPRENRPSVAITVAIIGALAILAAPIVGRLVEIYLPAVTPTTSVVQVTVTQTPVPVPSAATAVPTQAAVASTATATPTAQPMPILDTPIPTPSCLSAFVSAGKGFAVVLQKDCYYHFNIACSGCPAGVEDNYVIYFDGDAISVTIPEGAVWQYNHEPSQNEVCQDTADRWPDSLPSFLSSSGVQQLLPCRAALPPRQSFTKDQVDAALGAGNWRCFPDRLDGVFLIDVPSNFIVKHPIAKADKQGISYDVGQLVPSEGNATAWLNGVLSNWDQCPKQ